jgi:hypothetical protein
MRRQEMKLTIMVLCCLITAMNTARGDESLTGQDQKKVPIDEKVQIAGNCIIMPMGRIVLVRKGCQYCAVKFVEAWKGKTEYDFFANYESYYQGDGTGDFSSKNVQFIKEQLAWRRRVGLGKMFSFPAGPENLEIKCGPIKLFWSSRGSVYFRGHAEKEGEYGIELAPTKWTDISEVNVFDSRLKWYRYDEKRKDTYIPIEQLWENGEYKK